MTSLCPPESFESVTATRAVIPPAPRTPEPIRTSVSGEPSIVRRLSVTSWPMTVMPLIRFLRGTVMCSPLMLMRTGSGFRRSEWLRKKTALARTRLPSARLVRPSPGPSATMHAPSEVTLVSSWVTQSPRVA